MADKSKRLTDEELVKDFVALAFSCFLIGGIFGYLISFVL